MPASSLSARLESTSLQTTTNLSAATLLKYEAILLAKLDSKQGNRSRAITKMFQQFDQDKSGNLSPQEFSTALSYEMNGLPKEHLTAFAKLYDVDNSGSISLPELIARLLSDDAGVKLAPPPPATSENFPPPPPPKATDGEEYPSVIPQTGQLLTRLTKFRSSIRNLICVYALKKSRALPSNKRLSDKELVHTISRELLTTVFNKHTPNPPAMTILQWQTAFDYLCRSPTQPSLHPKDLECLHKECNDGDYLAFIDSIFPPPPTLNDLVTAQNTHRSTAHVYALHEPNTITGAPENGYGAFDGDGTGERLIPHHPITAVPDRINYRYSRTPVCPPTGFAADDIVMSGRKPVEELALTNVFGFVGDRSQTNLYAVGKDTLVYCIASLGVVYNTTTKEQRFFKGHDDDITAVSVTTYTAAAGPALAGKSYAVSGQMGKYPFIAIWDVVACGELYRLGVGVFSRGIAGCSLSPDGVTVLGIGCDDSHTMCVWNLKGQRDKETDEVIPKMMATRATQQGTPIAIREVVWVGCQVEAAEGRKDGDKRSVGSRASTRSQAASVSPASRAKPSKPSTVQTQYIITAGTSKHLKFWEYTPTTESLYPDHPTGPLTAFNAKFGAFGTAHTVESIAVVPNKEDASKTDLAVVAGSNASAKPLGKLWVFRISTRTCLKAVDCAGVYLGYCVRFDPVDRLLYSGGGDGVLKCWDLKLNCAKEFDMNPAAKRHPRMLSEPDSLLSKATLAVKRGSLFASKRERTTGPMATVKKNAMGKEMKEDKAKPKTANLRGEGDVWVGNPAQPVKPKLKHMALLRNATSLVVAVGMGKGSINMVDVASSKMLPPARTGHCAHVYGLCAHPTLPDLFLTVGQDGFMCVWDTVVMACAIRRVLNVPAKSVTVSPDGRHVAVGLFSGACLIIRWDELMDATKDLKIHTIIQDCEEDIDDLKFSPDGTMLAIGSHDNYVDVYSVAGKWNARKAANDEYTLKFRLKGHTSYITHLDWSKDSRIIQSNCGAYEILYWDTASGRQIRSTMDNLEADTNWATWTCVLGFPVMGIWNAGSDGTDVNSCDVDEKQELIVTADDFGSVNLLRYPAVAKCAAKREYEGHAAHVMNVRFLKNGKHVVSVGGKDRAVMVWRLDRNEDKDDRGARPKPKQGTKWMPQGGWDNGRELEHVGPAWAMTDQFANAANPRAVQGWVRGDEGKMKYTEPEKPHGDYVGRFNDGYSSRA